MTMTKNWLSESERAGNELMVTGTEHWIWHSHALLLGPHCYPFCAYSTPSHPLLRPVPPLFDALPCPCPCTWRPFPTMVPSQECWQFLIFAWHLMSLSVVRVTGRAADTSLLHQFNPLTCDTRSRWPHCATAQTKSPELATFFRPV